jgi:hypothetical protein
MKNPNDIVREYNDKGEGQTRQRVMEEKNKCDGG